MKIKQHSYDYVKARFEERGFQLVSTEYANMNQMLDYICVCGRQTQKSFSNFLATSGKCRECMMESLRERSKTHTFEEVKRLFEESGCQLLENEYVNIYTPMKYRCKCGQTDCKKLRHINPKLGVQCFNCSLHYGEGHHMWCRDREAIHMRRKIHDKCRMAVRNCLRHAGKKKSKTTREYVSFSDETLLLHFESFPNWDTLKKQKWEIDHIFPVKAFIQYGIYEPQIINSLDNLQPLTREENLKKGKKYDKRAFEQWLKCHSALTVPPHSDDSP
jgi:hypothetical protein